MAQHLTPAELDMITALSAKKQSASEILEKIEKQRRREKLDPPKIWAVRRAVAGAHQGLHAWSGDVEDLRAPSLAMAVDTLS